MRNISEFLIHVWSTTLKNPSVLQCDPPTEATTVNTAHNMYKVYFSIDQLSCFLSCVNDLTLCSFKIYKTYIEYYKNTKALFYSVWCLTLTEDGLGHLARLRLRPDRHNILCWALSPSHQSCNMQVKQSLQHQFQLDDNAWTGQGFIKILAFNKARLRLIRNTKALSPE